MSTLPTREPSLASAILPSSPHRLTSGIELGVLSATILFLELALIRWGGAQVRVLAYFPNLLLIGAFLGLGLGCLRAEGPSLQRWWLPSLLLLVACYAGLGRIAFTQHGAAEHLWLLYYDLPDGAPVVRNVWMPVVACFILCVLAFVPPGQLVANRLRAFQAEKRGLIGYSWDLGGSLIGTLLFAAAALWRLEAVHWFVCSVIAIAVFEARSVRGFLRHGLLSAAVIFVVFKTEHADVYSPYYALSRIESEDAVRILANGSLHQAAIDTRLIDAPQEISPGYHLPYTAMEHRPRRALVLGAGSGNDVATLLQNGAESIDAVEIDPVIIELGRESHPNRPYDSPRVRIINTDARAFLNESKERYDTIVFGTLDSMTRLSALSNVRLDNFVYTTECMAAARRHLTPDGALILYFMSANHAITTKIAGILTRAFGEPPLIHKGAYSLFNTIFLAGPSFDRLRAANPSLQSQVSPELINHITLPHDDWPFLYLDRPSISRFYLIVMTWIAGVALVGVWLCSRKFEGGFLRRRHVDGPMFLFGLAFLLLETRAVTAMNLVWGGTWLTSAVVFGAILFTVLLGTIAFSRRPWSLAASTIGLTTSLAVLYMIPSAWLLTMNVPLRLALSVAVVGTPVLFASLAFARLYTTRAHVGHAFGWNLLGAVAGGLAEFGGMVVGLRALLLLALAAYLLAYLLENRRLTQSLQTQVP